jgi:predicted flap endonuclease-1-like 5' DNA nuclease
MSEFLAAYGLWLLIALLVIILLVFLFTGKKPGIVNPASLQASPADAPASTPTSIVVPSIMPEPILDHPIVDKAGEEAVIAEPVTLVSGASTTIFTPVPVDEVDILVATQGIPAPASDGPDNLLLLKGVGPKLATLLTDLGITRFAQIATWTDADLSAIDTKLGTFKGRPTRDQWIDQAKYLAAGDTAGFEAKYGKL